MCESPCTGVGGTTDFPFSQHELAQERLYRLWRAGWITEGYAELWAQSVERLQGEGDCEYLMYVFRTFPALVESDAANERAI